MTGFHDHFSSGSAEYASFRPRYPETLFDWLATVAPHRRLAWDCATGSGQAAVPLARRFEAVVATDASEEQIAHAERAPGVTYRRAEVGSSGFAAGSVALVTVAQAYHWLDGRRFFDEARAALAPGGVVAVWCYGVPAIDPEIDRELLRFYGERVGRYWPPQRVHVERGYRDLALPLEEFAAPELAMEARWTLAALLGYVATWSAVRKARQAEGRDPMTDLESLRKLWGDPSLPRRVHWPLSVRAGRVAAG